jgi:hypothetical protein
MKKIVLVLSIVFGVANISFAANYTNGTYLTMTKEPITLGTGKVVASKSGSATNVGLMYLIAFGDASVGKIATEAGITTVARVEKDAFSLLGFFRTETITVYGN